MVETHPSERKASAAANPAAYPLKPRSLLGRIEFPDDEQGAFLPASPVSKEQTELHLAELVQPALQELAKWRFPVALSV